MQNENLIKKIKDKTNSVPLDFKWTLVPDGGQVLDPYTPQERLLKTLMLNWDGTEVADLIHPNHRYTYFASKFVFPNVTGLLYGYIAYFILRKHYRNIERGLKAQNITIPASNPLNKQKKQIYKNEKLKKHDFYHDLQKLGTQSNDDTTNQKITMFEGIDQEKMKRNTNYLFSIFYALGFLSGLANFRTNSREMAIYYEDILNNIEIYDEKQQIKRDN